MKTDKKPLFTVREMVFTAICAAIICVLAPISFPIGTIPISLGTFAIYFTAALLGGKRGTFILFMWYITKSVNYVIKKINRNQ